MGLAIDGLGSFVHGDIRTLVVVTRRELRSRGLAALKGRAIGMQPNGSNPCFQDCLFEDPTLADASEIGSRLPTELGRWEFDFHMPSPISHFPASPICCFSGRRQLDWS